MECFVEPEWLEAVAGKDFFYPAAFMDIAPFVSLFAPYIRHFICNDPCYNSRLDRQLPVPDEFRLTNQSIPNPALRDQPLRNVRETRIPYRDVEPSTLEQQFSDGRTNISVIRRRGFGQYALLERPRGSIGVFAHRKDTPYEGGSNVWFLANKPKNHEPLANLWDKLTLRLADHALIISDGSLTTFQFLMPDTSVSPEEDYRKRRINSAIVRHGFIWTCAGFMPGRGHSLIWGVTRS